MTTTATAPIFDLPPFKPTTEQARFLFEIAEFMESSEDFFILRGSAGTGKTSVAKAVVDYLTAQEIPCRLSAPTTRAVHIIGRKTQQESRTLHSRIYLIEPLEDGRVKTSLRVNNDEMPTLYIVDESSMVSDHVGDDDKFVATCGLLSNFLSFVKSGHAKNKVLFIGDMYQLPPIGYAQGEMPPALSKHYLYERFGLSGRVLELADVKRQAEGSRILQSATSLRDAMRFGCNWRINSERVMYLSDAVNAYRRAFDPTQLDAVIYIAPYHKSLNNFNTAVRECIGLSGTLSVGDVMVFHQRFIGVDYEATNDDFGTVVELESGVERFGSLHFQQVVIELPNEHGQLQRIAGKVCLEFLKGERPELMREAENTLYMEVMRTDKAFRENPYTQNHLNPYLGAMRLRYGYGITATDKTAFYSNYQPYNHIPMATSLKKHLQSLTKDELVEEVLKLAKRFKEVKTYFDMELGDTTQQTAIVESVKQKIKKQFFPTRGYGNPKAAEVRKLISEFRKVSVFPFDVVDVLLFRVEQAVDFTNTYGDISETFYIATETAYEDALKLITANNLKEHFMDRCLTIRRNSRGIGWGFSDQLDSLTEEYLGV